MGRTRFQTRSGGGEVLVGWLKKSGLEETASALTLELKERLPYRKSELDFDELVRGLLSFLCENDDTTNTTTTTEDEQHPEEILYMSSPETPPFSFPSLKEDPPLLPKPKKEEGKEGRKWGEGEIERSYEKMKGRKDEWECSDEAGIHKVEIKKEEYDEELPPVDTQRKKKERKDGPLECLPLKFYYDSKRTGLQDSKEFPIKEGVVVAGRYIIKKKIGKAAFSRAAQCLDLETGEERCLKIIENKKDYIDQGLDEIRLLRLLKTNRSPDDHHVLRLTDYFYFKEHLFIVTELLRDNLFEFGNYNRYSGDPLFFTLPRLKKIAKQCLQGLKYSHGLNILHCDIKPENILFRNYSTCDVKIIDFGNGCFVDENACSYIQSRPYRAPEVILGSSYDGKIDIWSLGCVLYEMLTNHVLFPSHSLPTLLMRMTSVLGEFPQSMLDKGRLTTEFFGKDNHIYEYIKEEDEEGWGGEGEHYYRLTEKETSLAHLLHDVDKKFVHFLSLLLELDPEKRVSAAEALEHPWLKEEE